MTPNKEDYLKCIYEIGTEVEKISNKGNRQSHAGLSTRCDRDD